MKNRIAMLCAACHKTVHAVLSTKEIEAQYASLESLRHHPDIEKYLAWAEKHPLATHVRVRRKKR